VGEGNQQQFVASVLNTTNVAVNWLVDNVPGGNSSVGTIDASGHYTAPFSPGTHSISAVSQADPTKSAAATLTVTRTIIVTVSPATATVLAGTLA
jgi:chitinase